MNSIFNQIKYAYPVKYVKVNNHNIAYIDEGTADNVLLFIHGLGSYLKAWDKNIPELKKQFRCIALDLPGYGKSSKQIHDGSLQFYILFLNKFINKLKLDNITLVGHSMGGQISISFVLAYPDKIKNLILVAPAGFETFDRSDNELIKKLVSPELIYKTSDKQIRLNYQMNFFKMPVETESMINDRITVKTDEQFFNHCTVVSNSLFGLLDAPVFGRLKEINIPTLIFFGIEDYLIPNKSLHQISTMEVAENGAKQIKGSKLILLDRCGHFLQYEKPDEFNRSVISFMNNIQ